jgi:hypothetical protein
LFPVNTNKHKKEVNKMIISDLQYIESAKNTEVQGGNWSYASAYQNAQAYGRVTWTQGNSYAIADARSGVSLSGSSSRAFASN